MAVDLYSQELCVLSEGSVREAVIASSCIPGVFKPLELDGRRYVDGGILERVPYPQVKNMGADIVVAVDVLGTLSTKEKCPSTLGVLLETIDIMDNYRTKIRREANGDLYDFWIEPDLGTMNQYLLKEVKKAYEKGYEIGKEYAPKIKKALKA